MQLGHRIFEFLFVLLVERRIHVGLGSIFVLCSDSDDSLVTLSAQRSDSTICKRPKFIYLPRFVRLRAIVRIFGEMLSYFDSQFRVDFAVSLIFHLHAAIEALRTSLLLRRSSLSPFTLGRVVVSLLFDSSSGIGQNPMIRQKIPIR